MPWRALVDWSTETPYWRAYGRVVMAETRAQLAEAMAEEAGPGAVVTVITEAEVDAATFAQWQAWKAKQAQWVTLARTAQAGRGLL
jgi:hypothetical protein